MSKKAHKQKMSNNEKWSTLLVVFGLLFIFDKPISWLLGN